MIIVDDPDDARLRPFRLNERGLASRAQRRDDGGDGLFIAEGDLVVQRALDAGCTPVLALVDADRPPALLARLAGHVEVFAGGDAVRAQVTKLGMPYDIVALFERPPRATAARLVARCQRLVAVEAVDNPVNVGSIVRNALALGWDGLLFDSTSADPLARRSLRVSMGNAFTLPHARINDLPATINAMKREGITVCALTPAEDAVPLDEVQVDERMAIVVGSERAGLTLRTQQAASLRVCIPMHSGVDSVNVAAASAIACWHLRPR